jgi:hypothetical protein
MSCAASIRTAPTGAADRRRRTLGFLHEVRDQHNRGAVVPDPLDQGPGVAARLRIEAGSEVVQHDHLRLADQGERDREPLPLAARQLAERGLLLGGQAERRHQRPPVGRAGVERAVQPQRLADPQQLGVLQLDAEALAQLMPVRRWIQSQHANVTGIRLAQPLDALDCGGLAGSVRTDDAEDLAALHPERDVADHGGAGVLLGQPVDLEGRCHVPSWLLAAACSGPTGVPFLLTTASPSPAGRTGPGGR